MKNPHFDENSFDRSSYLATYSGIVVPKVAAHRLSRILSAVLDPSSHSLIAPWHATIDNIAVSVTASRVRQLI
jgi:hypothetical protein